MSRPYVFRRALCGRLLLHFRKLPKISYFCCTVVLLCNIGCLTVSAFFSQPFGTIDAFPFAEPLVYVFSISIRALTRIHHHRRKKENTKITTKHKHHQTNKDFCKIAAFLLKSIPGQHTNAHSLRFSTYYFILASFVERVVRIIQYIQFERGSRFPPF